METLIPIVTVINYYQSINIGSLSVILPCSSAYSQVKALRELSKSHIMTSFSLNSVREEMNMRNGAILDVTCPSSADILHEMSSRKLFSIDCEWLLLESSNEIGLFNGTYLNPINKDLYILPGSRVTLAQYSVNNGMVAFFDMYRIVPWTPTKFKLMTLKQLNSTKDIVLRKERSNFEGVTLRTGTVILLRDEFKGFGSFENLEADFYAKALIIVARDIAFQYNFSMTLLVEELYGVMDKNGNFNGLVGKIQRNEIDLIATGVIMRQDRMSIADFTGSVYEIRSPIIFRQPSLSALSNIFLLPFSKSVWFAALITSTLFAFVLGISYRIGNHLHKLSDRFDISIAETITTILSCISQQGPLAIGDAPRARIALLLFELMIFFLFVAYSAKIVALLQSSVQKIKTLSDLIESPLEVGIQDIIYNRQFFQETNNPEHMLFYSKKMKPHKNDAYLEPEEGLERLKSGMFAFKVETEWANRVIANTFEEKEKCGLGEINIFDIPKMSMPVPKRSGLREHITRSITRQREVGLLTRVTKPFTSSKPICNSHKLYTSVNLVDFKPALKTALFGAILSVSLLLIEIFMSIRVKLLKKIKESRKPEQLFRREI